MKIKTSEATPDQLNYLVALCEGHEVLLFDDLWRANAASKAEKYSPEQIEQHLGWQRQKGQYVMVELRHLPLDQRNPEITTAVRGAKDIPDYAADWSQGGPIIDRAGLTVGRTAEGTAYANFSKMQFHCYGPTPLVAAMRSYVWSKLGNEVDVPEDLK